MRGLEDRFARPPRMCEAGVELIDIVGFFEGEPSKADPIFRGSKHNKPILGIVDVSSKADPIFRGSKLAA